MLPALSVTDTFEVVGSMAMVTKMVSATPMLAGMLSVVSALESLATVPMASGDGVVLSRVKVMAAPVRPLPTISLSVAAAATVYVPSACEVHAGMVALLVQEAAVLPVVPLWVVARLKAADCQARPVQ